MKTWTEKEVSILLENYNRVSNDTLQKMIPGKSPLGIYKKAYKLGLRKSPEIESLNRSEARKGEKCPNWNGGVKTNRNGYRLVLCPEHHRSDPCGYVLEHILVWERESGTTLPANCCIHHLNGVKTDNRIENLCVMLRGAHTVFHHTGAKRTKETRENISNALRRNRQC